MEPLDTTTLLSFKKNETVQKLDNNIIELFSKLFGNSHKKKITKKNINILKNQKIQNKKDNIINKINLILNKLSESNFDNLIIEFLENINKITIDEFDEIQKTFYLKILSEVNFIKIYLQFLKLIGYIYGKTYSFENYNLSYFYNIVESKFRLDYDNYNIDNEKFIFIKKFNNETDRINNLILIKNLIELNMLSSNLTLECDNIILNQHAFIIDIYYWFNDKNRELTDNEKDKIKLLLAEDNIILRESLLLETLIKKNNIKKNIKSNNNKIKETIIKTDTIKLECDNILDEYILFKSFDDVDYFINNRCTDAITKNKFSEILIDKILDTNDKDIIDELINLINKLINERTLFKSNLSKGLILIHNNEQKVLDYNNCNIKRILNVFNKLGITKGIEDIINKYNNIEQFEV
jgi:hypothetical protein